jgi:hypothetical protein
MIRVVEGYLMNKVVVDTLVRSRLDNLDSALELCDESGVTLGYFVPSSDRQRKLYEWARTAVTDEELRRARQEGGEFTLQQVLADLKDA